MITNTDYERVERAIRYLSEHVETQPSLDDVAETLGLSSFHMQRIFRRFAGITPKQFLQHLTLERAKDALDGSFSVLDAAYEAGLSSAARLHDHFVTLEAMTPGEYKSGGAGLAIRYGIAQTAFGNTFVASTARGICGLTFAETLDEEIARLHERWPNASLERDDALARQTAQRIFEPANDPQRAIRLVAAGTNFQVRVWKALLEIPFGSVRTYRQIAQAIGAPAATRAVASAVASNPIGYLIPCHRVILSTGAVGQYRWQPYRKRALLAWEATRAAEKSVER